MSKVYNKICDEFGGFEENFIPPNNLHLHRLFELCFFVGAASAISSPDEYLTARIMSTLSLVEFDRRGTALKRGSDGSNDG